jgi:hypothetical protein
MPGSSPRKTPIHLKPAAISSKNRNGSPKDLAAAAGDALDILNRPNLKERARLVPGVKTIRLVFVDAAL